MSVILDGKKISRQIITTVKQNIAQTRSKPGLAVIVVGSDPASHTYVEKKVKACREIGILSDIFQYPTTITLDALMSKIESLNSDPHIHGVLIQLPLPGALHACEQNISESISPKKDVDGLHPINIGSFMSRQSFSDSTIFLPCTPYGIIRLLQAYGISIPGKDVVIIGRSNLVGKPLGMLFLSHDATVTFCHSKTENMKLKTKQADILVSAVGKPKFINASYVKRGAVVVDVGCNYKDNLCVGDVDYDSVSCLTSAITPVPGGVGPMTVAILMENVWKAYKSQVLI
jgi:methylenetetrahydrofolate dehydrogenase (NADP+)/methenyltetrahydrofolate cyclohydrolase